MKMKKYLKKIITRSFCTGSLHEINLAFLEIVFGLHWSIDKVILKEPISKMKNGKTAGPSRLLEEIVNSSGESWVSIVADLLKQIVSIWNYSRNVD